VAHRGIEFANGLDATCLRAQPRRQPADLEVVAVVW
jgi:hypothetical protein